MEDDARTTTLAPKTILEPVSQDTPPGFPRTPQHFPDFREKNRRRRRVRANLRRLFCVESGFVGVSPRRYCRGEFGLFSPAPSRLSTKKSEEAEGSGGSPSPLWCLGVAFGRSRRTRNPCRLATGQGDESQHAHAKAAALASLALQYANIARCLNRIDRWLRPGGKRGERLSVVQTGALLPTSRRVAWRLQKSCCRRAALPSSIANARN